MPHALDRGTVISGKVTMEERVLIETAAKNDRVTLSEYVRSAALMQACLDGNKAALKYVGKIAVTKILAQARELMPDGGRMSL